jgi:sec-independent protein translocase protein TatA
MGLDNPIHIAFLLILLLLVFGAKRLPEMGQSLGAGMRGFKESLGGEGTQPVAQPVTQPTPIVQQQGPGPIAANAPAPTAVVAPVAEPVLAPVEEPRAPLAA